jgi:very-short-patch-repair endonuclease
MYNTLSKTRVICNHCEKELPERGLASHVWRMHGAGITFKAGSAKGNIPWNKGLTKQDPRVALSAARCSNKLRGRQGRVQTKETKQLLSEKMKVAHAEGRAHNIGFCQWNNEPSYPEQFFMKVIENEFTDKYYDFNLQTGVFKIDFAWKNKMLAIEIDGQQHEDIEVKERDQRKDTYLISKGWKVLRIKWKEMFNDPQQWIAVAKNFVG